MVCLRFHNVFRLRPDPRLIGFAFLAGILGVTACAPPDPASEPARDSPPYLLLHDWFGASPVATPSFIRDHRDYLDSLPFDGIVAYLRTPDSSVNVSASVFTPQELGESEINAVLAPLKAVRFRRLTQNFAAVLGGRPPDFMEDWTAVVSNFARLAKASREAGLRGIYFDNEQYYAPWGDHPRGVRRPSMALAEYQEKARGRGREVMEAVAKEFPDIVVIVLHGPYISEPGAPSPLFPAWQSSNELLGPFFAGFVEGAGDRATVVDGGEIYHLRGDREFRESYEWRKNVLPSAAVDCRFMTASARAAWPKRVRFGFGVYDRPFKGQDMNPVILASTLANALRRSDSYVWLYVEGPSFLKPPGQGGASKEWIQAIRRARAAAPDRPTD